MADKPSYQQYLKPQPEALREKVDHIVVLMLENRSFDNLLGWLYENGTPNRGQQFEGLSAELWNPLSNIDSDGNNFIEKVSIRKNGAEYRLGKKTMPAKPVNYCLPDPDPGEGYKNTNYQLYQQYQVDSLYPPEPTGMGFVDNYKNAMLYGTYTYHDAPTDPRDIMNCYTFEQTPVLSTLAKSYAVCDQWFCSVPSQTLPNRSFVHASTSCGNVNNKPNNLCSAPTIFNQIQDEMVKDPALNWSVYCGTQLDKETEEWTKFSLTRLCMEQIQDAKFDDNFQCMSAFYSAAASGELPSYSFLEPQFSGPNQNDQHPPSDIRLGEQLIADVYNALKESPKWNQTLLVITYDEHGGCYDHYMPTATAKTPDSASEPGQDGFRFNRYGVRVPTVVVSPYIAKGTIARPEGYVPFDHSSVVKSVQTCFSLENEKYLNARNKNAPDLSCVLTLSTPRKDAPTVTPLSVPKHTPAIKDLHRTVAQLLTGSSTHNFATHDISNHLHEAYNKRFPDTRMTLELKK